MSAMLPVAVEQEHALFHAARMPRRRSRSSRSAPNVSASSPATRSSERPTSSSISPSAGVDALTKSSVARCVADAASSLDAAVDQAPGEQRHRHGDEERDA